MKQNGQAPLPRSNLIDRSTALRLRAEQEKLIRKAKAEAYNAEQLRRMEERLRQKRQNEAPRSKAKPPQQGPTPTCAAAQRRRLEAEARLLSALLAAWQVFLYSLGREFWPEADELAAAPWWLLGALPERMLHFFTSFLPAHLPLTLTLSALLALTFFRLYRRLLLRLPHNEIPPIGATLLRLLASMMVVTGMTGLLFWSFPPTWQVRGSWGSLPVVSTMARPCLYGGAATLLLGPIVFAIFYFFENCCRTHGTAQVRRTLLDTPERLFNRLDHLLIWPAMLLLLKLYQQYAGDILDYLFGYTNDFGWLSTTLVVILCLFLCHVLKMRNFDLLGELWLNRGRIDREAYPFYHRALALMLCHGALDALLMVAYRLLPYEVYTLLVMPTLGLGALGRWALALYLAECLLNVLRPMWNEGKYHRYHMLLLVWRILSVTAVFALLCQPMGFADIGDGKTLFDSYPILRASYEVWDNTHGGYLGALPLPRDILLPLLLSLAEIPVFVARSVLSQFDRGGLCWPVFLASSSVLAVGVGPLWAQTLPLLQSLFQGASLPTLIGGYSLSLFCLSAVIAHVLQRTLVYETGPKPRRKT